MFDLIYKFLCLCSLWAMRRTGASFRSPQKGKLASSLFPPPSPCPHCQQPWHICGRPAWLVPTTLCPLFSPECIQCPWERRLNTAWRNLHGLLDNLKTWKDSLSLDSRNSSLSSRTGEGKHTMVFSPKILTKSALFLFSFFHMRWSKQSFVWA